MADENRTVPADEAHSRGITLPEGASDSAPRRINPIPAVHTTGGGEDIKLPEAQEDIISDPSAPRFIKTGSVPKVTTRSEPSAETDVEKFTDRLSVRPQQRNRTGYTGKIRTYADSHSAPSDGGRRMIASDKTDSADGEKRQLPKYEEGFVFFPVEDEKTPAALTPEEDIKKAASSKDTAPTKEIADGEELSDTNDTPTRKIPEKGDLLREIAGTATDDVPRDPDQLMMDGYGEDGDDSREEALRATRAKKINSFHFWSKTHGEVSDENPDEKFGGEGVRELPPFLKRTADRFAGLDSSFTPVGGREYSDPEERKSVFSTLIKTRNKCLFKAGSIALAGIILLLIDIIVSASASKNGGFFTVLGGNSLVYNIINSVFLICSAAVVFPDLKAGLFSLLKIRPKTDTSLLFVYICAVLQNIAMYSNDVHTEYDLHLLTPAAILMTVPYLLSKLFFYDSTRQCFKAVSAKSDKSYLRKVSDIGLVRELLRDKTADGDVNVVYAGRTKFIGTFLKRASDSAAAGMPSSRIVLISIGVSFILGIVGGIIGKSFAAAATAMTLSALCSFPVSCLFVLGKMLADENRKLSLKSSFVQSFSDARDFSCVDDIVIDANDVIKADVVKCISAKNVKEKQAMFVAGSLTSVSGGLLQKAFSQSVQGFEERMPAVDGLVYEDKLGVSAWVSGCKILLGTHALLKNHNVGVPDESVVNALLEDGTKPVYLAIEGNFAALFSVKYTPLSGVSGNLAELADNGANILISTVDPNITDAYAEELLGLPEDSVRTLAKKASDRLASSRTAVTDSEEAGIVFGDSVESLCRCAATAIRLDSAKRKAKLIGAGASVFGLVISAFLIFTGAYAKTGAFVPVLLQAVWIAVCMASPAVFTGSNKSRRRKALRKDYGDDITDGEPDEFTADIADENDVKTAPTGADGNTPPVKNTSSAGTDPNTGEKKSRETAGSDASKNSDGDGLSDGKDGISDEMYSALDAFAEEQERSDRRKSRSARLSADTKYKDVSENDSENRDENGDTDDVEGDPESGFFGKAKRFFGGLFSVSKNDGEEDADYEDGDNGYAVTGRPSGKTTAGTDKATDGLTSDARRKKESRPSRTRTNEGILIPQTDKKSDKRKKAPRTAEEVEAAYKRKKDEDDRVRSIFTAPDIPEAPHYEIGEKAPEDAKFEPPTNTGTINVFDDSVFSPFEDDKIFAGLHDTPPTKYDF